MQICLVAPNDALNDPRARVSRHLLERAGHEVTLVLPGDGTDEPGLVRASPSSPGVVNRILRRRPDKEDRATALSESLANAAAGTGARLFVPTDPRALDAAVRAAVANGGAVARTPKMPPAGAVDLIDLAPENPALAMPVPGIGTFHTPDDDRTPYRPSPGRHSGREVVLCYRRSEINPGKYLEAGLRRSGATVRVETERIDLSSVDPGTSFVIFVEGPYPALEVTGTTKTPTLFWFHHGEHHLNANLRLIDRYRVDAVLMAHSWHLAFWVPVPVHRFPFGMASELLSPSRKLVERTYDVAMVGAKLRSGGPYGRRQQLVSALESGLSPHRLGFREHVSADEMADLYGDARIVINEGGTRHYPITMRVLEAVGSGAVLLSDRLPGMEMLLEEGTQYALLGDDVVADARELLSDPQRLQEISDSALERATGLHTYDHRVDELFAIAATTEKRELGAEADRSELADAIDHDVEVQRVAHVGAHELDAQLPDREVWDATAMDQSRLAPGRMETVAIRDRNLADLSELMLSARRYIYIEGDTSGLDEYLDLHAPQAVVNRHGGITRIDLMAPSYRIMPFELGQP